MIPNWKQTERRGTKLVRVLFAVALGVTFFASCAAAQTQPAEPKAAESKPSQEAYKTIYLANVTQQNDLNDIQTAIRNMLPKARLFAVQSQNAISIHGSPDDLVLAQKMVSDLDRPKKTCRLTYTITETDNGKRLGSQHFAMIAVMGQKTDLKQGSRVPIVTGAPSAGTGAQNSSVQFQYVDVGMYIQASLEGNPENLRLRTKVEQSSLAEEKSGVGAQDPVIRQTVLEGESMLVQGKTLVLGSMELPGGTRKLEVEVVAEPVK